MRNSLFALFALIALFASLGCPPPASLKFELDKEFVLKQGATATFVDDESFTIRFDQVTNDSRCPVNVECVTAGQADVTLTLTKDGATHTAALSFTTPNGTTNMTDFKGHTVKITSVEPPRKSDTEIKQKDYKIKVVVSKTPEMPKFELGKEFSLAQGATVQSADGQMFAIRFDSIAGDSRCPVGVQCIWAGRADVALTLSQGTASQNVTLASGDMSQGGAGEAAFNGYTVKLQSVEPPKMEGKNIEQKDYKVQLVVSK